jgi:predicted ATPase
VSEPRSLPPLSELRLQNFKSIADASITLSHLTLVVGANSSGKSNLLRGLLALSQTISSQARSSGFLLNGDRVNLGSFEDVLRQGGSKPRVGIGVTAVLDVRSIYPTPEDYEVLDELEGRKFSVQYDIAFAGTDKEDPILSPAQEIRMSVVPDEENPSSVVRLRRTTARRKPLTTRDVLSTELFGPRISSVDNSFIGTVSVESNSTSKLAAVELRGLLPWHVVRTRPTKEVLPEAWVRVISLGERYSYVDEPPRSGRKTTLTALIDLGRETLDAWQSASSDERGGGFTRFAVERYFSSGVRGRRVIDLISKNGQQIFEDITGSLDLRGNIPVVVTGRSGSEIRIACSALFDLFSMRIWHLAGLREAPLPLYPASTAVQRGDIGDKGQFVAAALYALRDRIVDCPQYGSGESQRINLRQAVEYWVSKLELLSGLEPHHLGSLGLDIAVSQPGLSEPLNITSVGLGVSQLLPVVVRCLLAEPGDVVLLEQPELHLHPASQQNLADFLLACARSGRQLIVETHSEHLINRLRLRAAEDESEDAEVAQTVSVICAERDRESGTSTYRCAELNEFGGFDHWPAGFFDPGIAEAQKILELGISKLRERSDDGFRSDRDEPPGIEQNPQKI